ncbi:MAG: BglII/BstYI family type II restriction endonuclease [Dehalococcoidia bacterium]|jgi:hypothetical protein
MIFRHVVGKSTLTEGLTVHREFESLFESPEPGQKRDIILLFGAGQSATVTLRKLNNARHHVQLKYEKKSQLPFLNWLNDVFKETRSGNVTGEILEFKKIERDVFEVKPITSKDAARQSLYVARSIHHNSPNISDTDIFREVTQIVNNISFKLNEGQSYYNTELRRQFIDYHWEIEGKAIPELNLKYDFRKSRLQIEVEFGNARTYYQDYIKFMLSYHSRQIDFGMLITPTIEFASTLCEVGKQKALLQGGKSYSGMMHFEKAYRELNYLKDIFNMPITILGIDITS